MSATIINGRRLADEAIQGVMAAARELPRCPGLGVVIVGDDPASHIYVRGKQKRALEAGFLTEVVSLTEDTSEREVLETIGTLNARDEIDGILVQLPLPSL